MMVWQARYASTAGAAAVAPMRWPANTALPFHAGRHNLLVFVHPQCPCSRATLSELARITAAAKVPLDTRVLVLQYANQPQPSFHAPLYRQASGIPGVSVSVDQNGQIAQQFNAACSGQVFLYDPSGQLLFAGGITPLRGHEGDNAGEDFILQRLGDSQRFAAVASTPVFGCELFDQAAEKRSVAWPKLVSPPSKEPTCQR